MYECNSIKACFFLHLSLSYLGHKNNMVYQRHVSYIKQMDEGKHQAEVEIKAYSRNGESRQKVKDSGSH